MVNKKQKKPQNQCRYKKKEEEEQEDKEDPWENLEILKPLILNLQVWLQGFINGGQSGVEGARKGGPTVKSPCCQRKLASTTASCGWPTPRQLPVFCWVGPEHSHPVSTHPHRSLSWLWAVSYLVVCCFLTCSLTWKIAVLRVLLLKMNKNLLPFSFYWPAPVLPPGYAQWEYSSKRESFRYLKTKIIRLNSSSTSIWDLINILSSIFPLFFTRVPPFFSWSVTLVSTHLRSTGRSTQKPVPTETLHSTFPAASLARAWTWTCMETQSWGLVLTSCSKVSLLILYLCAWIFE